MSKQDQEQFLGQGNPAFDARSVRRRDGSLVDFEDQSLRALFYLFQEKGSGVSRLAKEHVEQIAKAAIANPESVQLIDFVDQIGLPQEVASEIKSRQNELVPAERRPFFDRYARVISTTNSIEGPLSRARLNPFTQFENKPPLLFGMGGGSKAICKGFPIDVLSMVLTAEKLRRELSLGRCRVICANGITYTNIPNNSEFSQEGIDRVLSAERDILQLALERFGIADHWDVFLESDIEKIIGREGKEVYDHIVEDAEATPFISGHHYALEMAQMYTLLNQETGGVKLGWFIRNINRAKPEYIMDEQPFDARYTTYLAYRGLTNRISIPYARAGVRLYPGIGGVNKDAPYICYDPNDRILLSPFEDPVAKLDLATRAGGGLQLPYIKGHFATIARLFEELVLGEDLLSVPTRVQLPQGKISAREKRMTRLAREQNSTELVYRRKQIDDLLLDEDDRFESKERVKGLGRKLQFILDYIFEGNRAEAEKIYRGAFPV